MQWARPETYVGQHGMPLTLRVRLGPSPTLPRTNSVLLPTRLRPHVTPRRKAGARPQDDLNAVGSVTNSRRRFASSYLTTSGCGTTSAGQCLTAERARVPAPPTSRSSVCRGLSRPAQRSAFGTAVWGSNEDPASVIRVPSRRSACRAPSQRLEPQRRGGRRTSRRTSGVPVLDLLDGTWLGFWVHPVFCQE